jgi:hypothetical protein
MLFRSRKKRRRCSSLDDHRGDAAAGRVYAWCRRGVKPWPTNCGWDILPDHSVDFAKSILERYDSRVEFSQEVVDGDGRVFGHEDFACWSLIDGYGSIGWLTNKWNEDDASIAGATFLYLWLIKDVDVSLADHLAGHMGFEHYRKRTDAIL